MAALAEVYEDLTTLKDLTGKLYDEHAYESGCEPSEALELLKKAEPLVTQLIADYDALTKALAKSRG